MNKPLTIVLLLSVMAFAQGGRYDNVAYGPQGPISNATVAVCAQPASIGTQPCAPLVPLYTDNTLRTTCAGSNGCSNPLTADGSGKFHFYGHPGLKYTVEIYGAQVLHPYVLTNQTIPFDPANAAIARLNGIRFADQFSGPDIGAKINAAFSDCSDSCTVIVAPGNYNSATTTVNYPAVTNGQAHLVIAAGAVINYTGSGCFISAISNTPNLNLKIDGGGTINGTSRGVAAICIGKFNVGHITGGLILSGFTDGAGIKNSGANSLEIDGLVFRGNKYGYWGIGSGDGFAPNAVNIHNNMFNLNTVWGIFLDASEDGVRGTTSQQLITVKQNTFESNGTDLNDASGHMFAQSGIRLQIEANYFEYASNEYKHQCLLLGDNNFQPSGITVAGNFFNCTHCTDSIKSTAYGMAILDNLELAAAANFLEYNSIGNPAANFGSIVWHNSTLSPTVVTGTGQDRIDVIYRPANGIAFNRPLTLTEKSAPLAASGASVCYADSTSHALECSYNGKSFLQIPQLIARGKSILATGEILPGSCAGVVTAAAAGVTTQDTVNWSFNAFPGKGYRSGLVVLAYVTSGNVNFIVCNPTAQPLKPGAAILNWSVLR